MTSCEANLFSWIFLYSTHAFSFYTKLKKILTSQIMSVAISDVSISDGLVMKFSVDLELHFHFCASSLPSYIKHMTCHIMRCAFETFMGLIDHGILIYMGRHIMFFPADWFRCMHLCVILGIIAFTS